MDDWFLGSFRSEDLSCDGWVMIVQRALRLSKDRPQQLFGFTFFHSYTVLCLHRGRNTTSTVCTVDTRFSKYQ